MRWAFGPSRPWATTGRRAGWPRRGQVEVRSCIARSRCCSDDEGQPTDRWVRGRRAEERHGPTRARIDRLPPEMSSGRGGGADQALLGPARDVPVMGRRLSLSTGLIRSLGSGNVALGRAATQHVAARSAQETALDAVAEGPLMTGACPCLHEGGFTFAEPRAPASHNCEVCCIARPPGDPSDHSSSIYQFTRLLRVSQLVISTFIVATCAESTVDIAVSEMGTATANG